MKRIWAIARKELRGYFDHPTAYILLVVFLVINSFFYFRAAYLLGEASLRPMFDFLPWLFLFFVPAVTMSAVAEERRQGTLEVVLSHPIREHEFLLGKYLGNLIFVAIALAATLVVPISLEVGGDLAFGVLVAQYAGGLLLAAAMVAVGTAASALTRNQITAFIVATATIFAFVLIGIEVVLISVPGWLSGVARRLAILPHFNNVARGVLDLRDVVYFVGFAVAFLAVSYWLLLRDRLNRAGHLYRNLRLGTAAIVGLAVVANLLGGHIPGRLDLTPENLYTLSDGTKDILRGLDDVVTITLFVSKELPSQVELAKRDIEDLLRDLRRYGDGNIQIVRRHPDESDEAREAAQRLGVVQVQFNVMRREELQLKQGWLGLAVQYAGDGESVPFVRDATNLEYELARHIWALTRERTPKIALVSGQGERGAAEYSAFREELGQSYEVTTLNLSAEDSVPSDVDALMIAGPRQPFGTGARRAVRDYLGRDGRVLYLGDGVDVNMRFIVASATPDSVREFISQFGVALNDDVVYDVRSNEAIQVPTQTFSYVVQYPFWVRAVPASDHPITRDLNSVFFPWPSSLDTLGGGGRTFMPLLSTTEYGGHQTDSYQIRPNVRLSVDREELGPRLLAVALEGAWPSPATPVGDGLGPSDSVPLSAAATDTTEETVARPVSKRVSEGPAQGRLVVVGDSDFLGDQFVRSNPGNIVFALNALDWLTQTDALMAIRSKTPTPRPLVFESELTKQMVRYLNLIGVPLAFVIVGAVRLWRRRRLTRRAYGS